MYFDSSEGFLRVPYIREYSVSGCGTVPVVDTRVCPAGDFARSSFQISQRSQLFTMAVVARASAATISTSIIPHVKCCMAAKGSFMGVQQSRGCAV